MIINSKHKKYDEVIEPLNAVLMEGSFYKGENRVEFADGGEALSSANKLMLALLERLSPKGEFGERFESFSATKTVNFQIQKQIESMMESTENGVREAIKLFGKGARAIERVFHGFFDETKDGIHESLQNMNTIKGHDNRQFKDDLLEIRNLLRKSLFYLAELEPIDNVSE